MGVFRRGEVEKGLSCVVSLCVRYGIGILFIEGGSDEIFLPSTAHLGGVNWAESPSESTGSSCRILLQILPPQPEHKLPPRL